MQEKETKQLDEVLINILGKDAFYSTDFKITDNVTALVKAVNYLFTQLSLCKNMMSEDDKSDIDDIKQNAIEILKGK